MGAREFLGYGRLTQVPGESQGHAAGLGGYLCDGTAHGLGGTPVDDYAGTLACKFRRDGEANAGRASAHQCESVAELQIHEFLCALTGKEHTEYSQLPFVGAPANRAAVNARGSRC